MTPRAPQGSAPRNRNSRTGGWKSTDTSENLLRRPLLHPRFPGVRRAYRRAWGVLKVGRGSAARPSSSGPSSSMLEKPISSWNWGEGKEACPGTALAPSGGTVGARLRDASDAGTRGCSAAGPAPHDGHAGSGPGGAPARPAARTEPGRLAMIVYTFQETNV